MNLASPPLTFGDYEVLEEIGRGGMGRVYKARQRSLGRVVALKTILGDGSATPAAVQRFRKEAEAAAQLDHPGIVPVYELGQSGEQYFFVMAFVEGRGLHSRLDQGPLDNRLAAYVVQHVAEAVAYAHDKGVVHRDLKPANVLIDRDGTVKVADFGLARRLDAPPEQDADEGAAPGPAAAELQRLTATGAVMGTPGYMAPEQALDAKSAGPAADVWALGALLYACLTGRPPFLGPNFLDTLALTVSQPPVPPRELNPTADPGLEAICLKCLAKEPAGRYARAADVADDLVRWQAGKPTRAARGSWLGRARRALKPHPAWLPVLAGLVAYRLTNLQEGILVGCALAGMRRTPSWPRWQILSLALVLGLGLAVFYGFYMGEHLTVTGKYADFFGLDGVAPGVIPFPFHDADFWRYGVPFFGLFVLFCAPVGPLLVTGLGSVGEVPEVLSRPRRLCWVCLALALVGLLMVPALAFGIQWPRTSQLGLERAGVLLLLAWPGYLAFRTGPGVGSGWAALTLVLLLACVPLLVWGFVGIRRPLEEVLHPWDFGPFLRREGWALTFWLLSVPVGVSVGVLLGGVRHWLAGPRDAAVLGLGFRLGAALAAVGALAVLRTVLAAVVPLTPPRGPDPTLTVGFACYGPGPASALAGRLLMVLGMNVAAAAAFVYPAKVLLLALPLAVGGTVGGAIAARIVRKRPVPASPKAHAGGRGKK